jgi:hypothetical protein
VKGSLCSEDLKRAVTVAERGKGQRQRERERERESYCEVKLMLDEVTEEGDALCYMWVSPQH